MLTNEEKIEILTPILSTFENDDIKNFTEMVACDFPDYIWEVGASSTGKHHPSYVLGKFGLIKHQIATCRFMNYFLDLNQYSEKYTSRERDLLRCACLVHDGLKSGTQDDYNVLTFTKFEHPKLMAHHILSYEDKCGLDKKELIFISTLISSYMGQWNTNEHCKQMLLPLPDTEPQQLVHLADYLASRKHLTMSFEDYNFNEKIDIDGYIMRFGKYKGTALKDIPNEYLKWLYDQGVSEPLYSIIKTHLKIVDEVQ